MKSTSKLTETIPKMKVIHSTGCKVDLDDQFRFNLNGAFTRESESESLNGCSNDGQIF